MNLEKKNSMKKRRCCAMLYEFECDKFAKKVNGQLVPRGRIQLRE